MPIQSEVTITTHDKALELFTDRFAERRLFANYLHAEIPFENIIFFHGDGGNGKSLLLKHLRTHWCKFLDTDDWRKAEHHAHDIEGNKNFTNRYETLVSPPSVHTPIPCIYHDFERAQSGEDSPREAWSVLINIRTELTKHKINFPLFDYAIMRYLHHGRGLSKEQIKSKLPMGELSLAGSLIDLVTSPEIPVAGLVVKVIDIFAKYKTTELALWSAKRNLNEDDLMSLHRLDTKSELIDELPQLFAQDLNTAMLHSDSPKRLVFMFDSHESFWGTERQQQSKITYFQRDEWLRRLLMDLFNPNHRITVVIAGREPPRWHEALKYSIPNNYINTQLVGQFGRDDADDYLYKALDHQNSTDGINSEEDKLLRTALINYAEVEPNQVHPLHLGLAADVVLMAKSQSKTITTVSFKDTPELTKKNQILIEQFLKYCPRDIEDAVIALAATRGFDETLFHSLGDKLYFHHTQATFTTLTGFSFVWEEILPEQNEEKKWYRIHSLLCHRINEYAEPKVQAAHSALESIYREKESTQTLSIVNAIYHANKQDWYRGHQEWVDTIESALNFSHYKLAEALIEVQPLLELNSEVTRGHIQFWIAKYNSAVSRFQAAGSAYNESIDAYSRALDESPSDITKYIHKGNAIYHLAQLHSHLGQTKQVIEVCEQAMNVYDASPVQNHEIYNNKSNVLTLLAQLHSDLGQYELTIDINKQAVNFLDLAQSLEPKEVSIYINKGLALSRQAKAHQQLNSDETLIISLYTHAIETYDIAIPLEPNNTIPHNNKGYAFLYLGETYYKLGKLGLAFNSYQKAMESIDKTINLAPNHLMALNCKALIACQLSQLQTNTNQFPQALSNSQYAVELYEAILSFYPNDIRFLCNMANVLLEQAKLYVDLRQPNEADEACQMAIKSINKALGLAPDNAGFHFNKGNILLKIAELHQIQRNPKFSIQAIDSYKESIKISPNNIIFNMNTACAFLVLGNIYEELKQTGHVIIAYQQAISHCDIVLSLNSEHTDAKIKKHHVQILLDKIGR